MNPMRRKAVLQTPWLRRRAVVFAGMGLAGAAVLVFLGSQRGDAPRGESSAGDLLLQARAALEQGDYGQAEELSTKISRDDDLWTAGQIIAAEAATREERFSDAITYYRMIPLDGSPDAVRAALYRGEVARRMGQLSEAERAYSYVIEQQPDDVLARTRLAFLLRAVGRRWESLPHYMFLLQSGDWSSEELLLLGDLERPMEQTAYLLECAKNAPNDPLVKLGLAAGAMADGHPAKAQSLLQQVVAVAPELVAAHAMLGELLVDGDEWDFGAWNKSLPPQADRYPDVWYVRGLHARRLGELDVAARCFWETIRLVPTHRRATHQLGQVLVSLGESSAPDFTERATHLYELTRALDDVLRFRGHNDTAMRRVVAIMEETGRAGEAYAWALSATETFPDATWPREVLQRVQPAVKDNARRTLESADLALRHDFSRFPDHARLLGSPGNIESRFAKSDDWASVNFVEEPPEKGIGFVYENGADPMTPGARMFEQTGGGVGVLDYDADGWPDLYFTQGAEWQTGATEPTLSAERTNRFYRNISGRAFLDLTTESGLGDQGFGQGCSVGDIDNDGFADLYVANIGVNRLYRNNGDGTFTDATEDSGLVGSEWTTSCVVVDLNADSLPDLFDVNYVTGPGVYEAICNGRACSPKVWEGVPDRVHLNRGDGSFEPIRGGTPESDTKGLGVLAATVYEGERPCLFIANDQVPNHFLRSVPPDDSSRLELREEGFTSGLAFNEDGLAMACMGIAADDVDGNGRIDFFVTNFKDESNTLYLQDAEGLFRDATSASGLRAPSWPFVGWGTQFLDADLDGEPDLVVANGHVDDYRDEGGEYHMRPQFFRNEGGGRFAEVSADQIGPFFDQKLLGRGLAKLDWNRDGRMDFVVSNIGAAASLVTNTSRDVGRFLNVRLHATATARDAIGTVVEVIADGRRWRKQLVAGDGYQASNERMLQFGLGMSDSVSDVRVTWPSGESTTLTNVPVNLTIDLAEGISPKTIGIRADDGAVAVGAERPAAVSSGKAPPGSEPPAAGILTGKLSRDSVIR